MHQLTTVEQVHDDGSYLFTAEDRYGDPEEVVVVPCADGVEAWRNRCTHEDQRFDTGRGVPMRDGEIICPRHGSLFDACDGTVTTVKRPGPNSRGSTWPSATGRSFSSTTTTSSCMRAASTTTMTRARRRICSYRAIARFYGRFATLVA